jgi:hypothetical protein
VKGIRNQIIFVLACRVALSFGALSDLVAGLRLANRTECGEPLPVDEFERIARSDN